MEWTLAVLHASTALRPEESFGLKWSDIDWENGQIHIRRGWRKERKQTERTPAAMTPGSDAPCSGSVSPGLAEGVPISGILIGFSLRSRQRAGFPGPHRSVRRITSAPQPSKQALLRRVTKADLDGTIAAIASQAFAVRTKSIQPSLSQSCGTRNCRRRWRFTPIALILCRWPRRRNSSKQLG